MWPDNRKLTVKKARLFLLFILFMGLVQVVWTRSAHGQTFENADRTSEKFLANASKANREVTLSFRDEATVVGSDIRLKQIARWSDSDKEILDPIGELIVAHLDDKSKNRILSISDAKNLLRDAGINIATINFTGAAACRVSRSDAVFDQNAALEKWAKETPAPTTTEATVEKAAAVSNPPPVQPIVAESPYKNLQQLLVENLAAKLSVPADTLQVTFRGQDDKVLRLMEPHYKFGIEPQRCGNLGEVSWNVVVSTNDVNSRYFIQASARAWQEQVLVSRPLAFKQQIIEADIETRRVLTDKMPDGVLLRKDQVIGQVSSRDFRVGTLLTARCVESPPMVRAGQFVTVEYVCGGVIVKSVVRALEGGAYGQTIHVKNETTKDIFKITVTGPQQGSMGEPSMPATLAKSE